MMVDMIVVAVLVTGTLGLLVSARWWGRRRAELPMMLERAAWPWWLWRQRWSSLPPPPAVGRLARSAAPVCLAAAGVTRGIEDATHRRIVEDEGGPASTSRWVGLPQVLTAICLLVSGGVVLGRWSDGPGWGR